MEQSYVVDNSNNDYKLIFKYLEIINQHFEFIVCDIWDRKSLFIKCANAVDHHDYIKRFNILYELIKDFFKKIEDGELEDPDIFYFNIENLYNIFEVKKSYHYYKSFTRCCHGIFKDKENDKKIVDSYEKKFKYLDLLISKINFIFRDEIRNLDLLISKERLYMKEEFVLKVCDGVIELDPISSDYSTLEEYHKSKNNLSN